MRHWPAAGRIDGVRFLTEQNPAYDLAYSDVFMVPNRSAVASRLDVDLATNDGSGTTIPVVVANMTAVAGRRMAETVARRGGLTVLPQDIPVDVVAEVVSWVKSRDLVLRHPADARARGHHGSRAQPAAQAGARRRGRGRGRRARSAWSPRPTATGVDRFTQLRQVMSTELLTLPAGTDPERAFELLHGGRHRLAPVVDGGGRCVGILTRNGALRSTLYQPATDDGGQLRIGGRPRHQRRRRRARPSCCSTRVRTCWSWTPRTATRRR